jgi:hypothetical protein
MKKQNPGRRSFGSTVLVLAAAAALCSIAVAQVPRRPPAAAQPRPAPAASERKAPASRPPTVNPSSIWPAGLATLAGKYVFVQVASPGGLWLNPARGPARQVSINEVPPALRSRLLKAEITISDLKLPTVVEASERQSPTRRGNLRGYDEATEGRLVLRNLPGIGGDDEDRGDFSGRVEFALEHMSHSNPSVAGVLLQRIQQEMTWGAATLDFATLMAVPLPPERPAGAAAAAVPAGGSGAAQRRPATPAAQEEFDPLPVIANARVLRSGIEIIALVKWRDPASRGLYHGSVRLARADELERARRGALPGGAGSPRPQSPRLPPPPAR